MWKIFAKIVFFFFLFVTVNILLTLIFNKIKNQIKSDALLNAFEQFQLTEKEMNDVKGGEPDFFNVYYSSLSGTVGFHYVDGNLTHYSLNGQELGAGALISNNDNTSLGVELVEP